MKEIEVKRVDLWDGGDRHSFGFYIDTKVSRHDITKAHPYCLIADTVLVVYSDLQEYEANKQLALKRRAYDKLSPLERQALGIEARP